MSPCKIIRSYAPVRICDLGGWTDTWFSWNGVVTNIAVDPGVECIVRVLDRNEAAPITIYAENFKERFRLGEGTGFTLIEAAVESMPIPSDVSLEISVFSEIPPGASMGTSAAVLVALIGALDLLTPGHMTNGEIARKAHEVEETTLKRQSGVQDQIASAYGGINCIEIVGYPLTTVSQIQLSDQFLWELESRLVTIFLGRGHDSSETHRQVIEACEGGTREVCLSQLRAAGVDGKNALFAEDLSALGMVMNRNLAAQLDLHGDLVGPGARIVVEVAKRYRALGSKVNGAGGDGGTITILSAHDPVIQREMTAAIIRENPGFTLVPTQLNRTGIRRWLVDV